MKQSDFLTHYNKLSYLERLYSGRINRTTFALNCLFGLIIVVGWFLIPQGKAESITYITIITLSTYTLIYIPFHISAVVRRLHDFNASGWSVVYQFFIYIPLLLLTPGKKYKNIYGISAPNGHYLRVLLGLKLPK